MSQTTSRLGRRTALLASFGLAACSYLPPIAGGPETQAELPPDAVRGAGDPVRSAMVNVTSAFSTPGTLAGRPADAARAIAQMEFLTVEIGYGARWAGVSGTFLPLAQRARAEWRGAAGISPTAAPQDVIDSLYGAARALQYGSRDNAAAALNAPVFREGGAAVLTKLAALPPLPATNQAATEAANALRRHNGQGRGGF